MNDEAFHIDEEMLRSLLAEHPGDDGWLWGANWGEVDSVPQIVTRLVEDLSTAMHSRTVLVHGRYGTGKTSFVRLLCKELHKRHASRECTKPFLCLWLHMPVLTNEIDSSALAAVMTAIVEYLEERLDSRCSREFPDIHHVLEDLWQIEANKSDRFDRPDHIEPPRPNRMVGGSTDANLRYHKANSLERVIDKCLDWVVQEECCPDTSKEGLRLYVVLDDLDRCRKQVPEAVIRMLLRFGITHGVHFIIASDRDVMEEGVRAWMNDYGKDGLGGPLVTANSALEKYLHHLVQLPDLSAEARYRADMGEDRECISRESLCGWLAGLHGRPSTDDGGESPHKQTLADLFMSKLLCQSLKASEESSHVGAEDDGR